MLDTQSLLPAIEITTGANPTHTILWMHGLGADGNDFVPIVHALDLSPEISIRFLFPHAPVQPVTINGGWKMRAWYDIKHNDLSWQEDETGLRNSQRAITALLEHEIQRGIPAAHIVLAGFSQGGAMALQTGLRLPYKLAGIMVLSGYLPLPHHLAREAHSANISTPIFMAHGTQDPVVPIALANTSQQLLLEHHHAVEWHEYPMAHAVCDPELADISRWLRKVLQ
ncbi:alpha/beta hydrolase [Nitrosomonas sp. ANs5]|uniref:alpha/beta hydrolase n=1 Tax=Nitrosomonas sp. ANs5 TaxID=3423941 RepID=UPI003D324897